ncbi:MAG: hypothetical protein OEZ47_17760, partial [Gammaproteobacteria bacterium]|nr:hypothetical protein [Gammaproteobacteria bacterium]
MEGYGFFKAATHYVPVDLIQLYKVVSDNTLQGIEAIDKASVYEWIKAKLAEIDHMRKQQFALAMELVQARDLFELEKLFEACHFTHYESVRLKQLLQRAKALRLSADAVEKVIGEGKNKKDILNGLDEILLQAGLGFRP